MRDYKLETEKRIQFIKEILSDSGADGVVFGNSGGKDSALTGILLKKACKNVLGVIMPCQSKLNYTNDLNDAKLLAAQFSIDTITIDLSDTKNALVKALNPAVAVSGTASGNINPRLRMTTLYAIAQMKNYLVAGTGNLSEKHMGYFTKWGDGAFDFNPIADLTVTEIYEYLNFFNAPQNIISKAPSAGLFDGQTDEEEMGVTYAAIDGYLKTGAGNAEDIEKIEAAHRRAQHKLTMPKAYPTMN